MAPGEAICDVAMPRIRTPRGLQGWRVMRGFESSPIEPLINCFWSNSAYCRITYGVNMILVCSLLMCTCVRDTYGMSNHCNRDDSLDISLVHFALYAWLRDIDSRLW